MTNPSGINSITPTLENGVRVEISLVLTPSGSYETMVDFSIDSKIDSNNSREMLKSIICELGLMQSNIMVHNDISIMEVASYMENRVITDENVTMVDASGNITKTDQKSIMDKIQDQAIEDIVNNVFAGDKR